MKPIAIMRMRDQGTGYGSLDRQTVVSGASGTAPVQDRIRGWASPSLGSISDGTSNIFGPGNAVTTLCWDENGGAPQYVLTITGATDSGWTTMRIVGPNGTKILTRTSRTSFVSNTWVWSTPDLLPSNGFGGNGDTIYVYFD